LRHSYTQRLETLAFDFEDLLLQANNVRGERRRELLEAADGVLLRLRAFLRYAFDLQLLAAGQLRYAGEQLDQLGRLLGAWLKGTDR
ncbi:MAG: four helix bundle protein, partial [Planctomycetaceae bacterium]